MTCSEYLVDFLIKHGVTDVFGYAGGYIVPFMDALFLRKNEIKVHVCYTNKDALWPQMASLEQAANWASILLHLALVPLMVLVDWLTHGLMEYL